MDLESPENSASLNSIVDSVLSRNVDRERYDELRDLPVLLLEGPVRSGKTTALERIHRQWRDRAPVVLVSGIGADVEPFKVAAAVADELKRRASVPTILFRRLLLGVAALSPKLSANSELAARELEELLAHRDAVMRSVAAVVGAARQTVVTLPIPETGRVLPHIGLAVVSPLTWRLRKRHRSYSWFATEMETKTAVQGLVQLNRWGAAGNWNAVNSLLMRAFLADLRTPFTSWLNSEKLTSNVILLLDDIDSAGGRRFIEHILVERREHWTGHAEGDPVMIVATSGTRMADGDESPFGGGGPASLCSVNLSCVQVDDRTEPPVTTPGMTVSAERLCRALAGGHPWGLGQLRRTVRGAASPAGVVHAESLLPPELAAAATERFLGGRRDELRGDLVTCSAVHPRDPLATAYQAALEAFPAGSTDRERAVQGVHRSRRVEEFVWRKLWAAPQSRALQPFLRQVLLCELSGREDAHTDPWNCVFERLRSAHEDHSIWHHHYLLAERGEVARVVGDLRRRLHRAEAARSWLDDLDCVTAAPRRRDFDPDISFEIRLDAVLGTYHENAGQPVTCPQCASVLDSDRQEESLIATIVGTLWLSRNGLGDPDLVEYLYVAANLDRLASGLSDRELMGVLLTRAALYRRHHQEQRFLEPSLRTP